MSEIPRYSWVQQFRKSATSAPDIVEDQNTGAVGLWEGYIKEQIPSCAGVFERPTYARSVCDALILLTIHPDRSATMTLTHLVPNFFNTKAQEVIVNTMQQNKRGRGHNEGTRFATLVTSDPYYKGNRGPNFEWQRIEREKNLVELIIATKKFNNGNDPDIVHVNHKWVDPTNIPADLIFSKIIRDGQEFFVIEVSNTGYRKEIPLTDATDLANQRAQDMYVNYQHDSQA